MKSSFAVVLGVVLLVSAVVGTYVLTSRHAVERFVSTHSVMQWVKDPNTGVYYYGWYSADGTAFNSTVTAPANHRMGDVQPSILPVYFWERVR